MYNYPREPIDRLEVESNTISDNNPSTIKASNSFISIPRSHIIFLFEARLDRDIIYKFEDATPKSSPICLRSQSLLTCNRFSNYVQLTFLSDTHSFYRYAKTR